MHPIENGIDYIAMGYTIAHKEAGAQIDTILPLRYGHSYTGRDATNATFCVTQGGYRFSWADSDSNTTV